MLRGGILTATVLCLSTLVLGACGLLTPVALGLLSAGLGVLVWIATSRRPFQLPARPAWPLWPPWPLWPSLLLVALQTLVVLPLPPDDWDAMTYHLFLPARWLQEGGFVHVPTVFGDSTPAFAPQNGALLFTWFLAIFGDDRIVGVIQVGALVLLAASLWKLLRRLGAGPEAAAMAVATLPWLVSLQRWTFTAQVDVFLAAFWLCAVAFLLGEGARSELVFGGLVLGLALGTKTIGLPLAVGLLGIAAPRLVRAPRRDLLLFAGAVGLTGSYWWLRNFWLYGNPLFPLDLSIGSWRVLPGVFDSAAMRGSIYHVEGFVPWLAQIHAAWGTSSCVYFGLGFAGLLAAWRHRLAVELALLMAGWTFFVWKVVPFNKLERFLLPALVLAVVGAGLLLERLSRRWRSAAFVLVLLVLAVASRPDHFVLQRLAFLASPLDLRAAVLAGADYALWRDGYLSFNHPEMGARRIAYSGSNVPYTLVGPGLRNRVVYCNVQGERGDGLYEFWRRDPVRHSTYRPELYRGKEDVETWLACLKDERIDTVVLFWVIPVEVPESLRVEDGFPVERRWMRERPERFRRVLGTERAEIWSVRTDP